MNKRIALAAKHGDVFHHGTCTRTIGPRGGVTETVRRYRVTGVCKTWKRNSRDERGHVVSPERRFRLPVKYGMYDSGYITETNACDFHAESECTIRFATNPGVHISGSQNRNENAVCHSARVHPLYENRNREAIVRYCERQDAKDKRERC